MPESSLNDVSSHRKAGQPQKLLLLLFAVAIFSSAFLLFQVQPLISRFILPWFGGSPAVWSTCMLFFQVTLFGGYVYAHIVTEKLAPRWQAVLHTSLLLTALFLLPITPDDSWKPSGSEEPMLRIVALLIACVGLPYFLLSSTGPLLQRWFSLQAPGVSPYRLYALSNVGSLLALVSYPFVFEPAFDSPAQAAYWSWGFGGFAFVCAACAVGLFRQHRTTLASDSTPATDKTADDSAVPSWSDRAMWFGLAMVASVMLLATTNQVCLDVATVPFLWILPLTLYLASFILCFDGDRWYSRRWYVAGLILALLGVTKTLLSGATVSIVMQVFVYLAALFACCMVCHGELSRQKPGPRFLTSFYLLMSAGGAGGGLFVGLLAPTIFPAYWELHIGIVACLIATLVIFFRDRNSYLYRGQPRPAWVLIVLWVGLLSWSLQGHARDAVRSALDVSRNFYGVLRVEDDAETDTRKLFHGSIQHGTQFLDEARRGTPTTYYGVKSGAGLVMQYHSPEESRRIGVVGLGVGTLATYGTGRDVVRFYEINPEVIRLAQEYFTFLSDTPARTEMILGDARLSLEHEAPQEYDVLVLDAFSGDAIPTHLLTKEAGELYLRHLKADGILCVHISNLHFDLRPVLQGLGEELGLHFVSVQANADSSQDVSLCHWMLLSRQPIPELVLKQAEELDELSKAPLLWTDEWSNLLSVLRD
jgi:hypothetical protein